jgi:hypothetical protein
MRVNPASVSSYADTATELFAAIRSELVALVSDVVGTGDSDPDAVACTIECGGLATQLTVSLLTDLAQITDAVRASTASLAPALGGAPVTVPFDASPVVVREVPPRDDPSGPGASGLGASGVEALRPVVTTRLGAVQAALQQHLSCLEATDWHGTAKLGAVDAVRRFTAMARSRAAAAESAIVQRIDRHVAAALAAAADGQHHPGAEAAGAPAPAPGL